MPVITSTRGLWVASTRWIPTARAFWARRMIESSTSAGATIIRSASSSITHTMYGQRRFAAAGPGLVELRQAAGARQRHDPVAGLHLLDQVGERVGGHAGARDHRREQVRDRLVVVELHLLGVHQHEPQFVRGGPQQQAAEHRVDGAGLPRARWCRPRAGGASSPGPPRSPCRPRPCPATRSAARSRAGAPRRRPRAARSCAARWAPPRRPPACPGSARGCGCRWRRGRRRGRPSASPPPPPSCPAPAAAHSG